MDKGQKEESGERIMVEVVNLDMSYGSRPVLKQLSFRIKKGKTVGLLGVNGAGKTTTMNLLTGYLTPKEGSVKICGTDMLKNPKKAKKYIGYLPEIPPVYKDIKVGEYLYFVAGLKGISDKKKEVERVLNLMDMADRQYTFIGQLSKGYCQRVGFAQALLGNPPVLILDEPLAGLDPAESKKIRTLIKELQEEHAILISSHILTEIEELCNEVVILKDGQLVMDDNSIRAKRREGKNRYQFTIKGEKQKIQEVLLAYSDLREVVFLKESEPGVFVFMGTAKDTRDIRDSVFSYLVGNKMNVYGITRVANTLEDVFMEATAEEEA